MKIRGLRLLSLAVVTCGFFTLPMLAQQAADNGGGNNAGQGTGNGNGNGGRRGNWDPAQMRAQGEARAKEVLGMSDDEFKAIQPKLEKILNLQRDLAPQPMRLFMNGGGRNRGPGGGFGPFGGDPANPSAVTKANTELQTVLDNKDASPDDIKAKMTAVREARTKATEELKTAQKEFTELLTARQEAVLVEFGILP